MEARMCREQVEMVRRGCALCGEQAGMLRRGCGQPPQPTFKKREPPAPGLERTTRSSLVSI